MHFESVNLHLMASKDAHQLILFEQLLDRFLTEVIGAFSLGVFCEVSMLSILVFHGVCPHEITEQAV